MTIAVVDVETTGLNPESASIVEFALVIDSDTYYSSLVKPRHSIEICAMAAHHITEEDIAGSPELLAVMLDVSTFLMQRQIEPKFFAAHSASFDSSFLPGISEKWICTYRCAQHLWPDAPGYSNQALRYYLLGDAKEEIKNHPAMALPPHRALPDAFITRCILDLMLEMKTPEQLVELTNTPVLQKTCGFGKHYGSLWAEVPISFLQWLLSKGPEKIGPNGRKEGFSDDVRHTAIHYMEEAKNVRPTG